MVTDHIDFEDIEQKTSEKFVQKIKRTVDQVSTWDEKEIQFFIEEDQYTLTVIMCIYGSISKHQYRFTTGGMEYNQIGWADIRNFFNIPLQMKKIKKAM